MTPASPATRIDPDACFQLGVDTLSQRRPAEALELFTQGERMGCDPDACAAQRWYCWMLLGEFDNAWRESDRIASRDGQGPGCLWDGHSFDGNRVLIRCLHGLGDALQFIRYAPLLRRISARVIVECSSELVGLFRTQPFIDHVISWVDGSSHGFSAWDQQIEVMELPRAFRTVPSRVPYLGAPRAEMSSSSVGPHVGLVWSASDWNPFRSLPLSALAPILQVNGITFHSFQHGSAREQARATLGTYRIHDHADHCPDILSTASILSNMDLLITVDTMAAHLAGALGIPVWTLLNWQADWRWMLDRADSPWYPTMRLFRQTEPGNWRLPIAAIARELKVLTQLVVDGNHLGMLPAQVQE